MRPLGFESRAKRFERSLVVGLAVGGVAVAIAVVLLGLASRLPELHSVLAVVVSAFGMGFLTGFALALTWPDYAPPQPKDDGDEEAGVPARLVPPLTPMSARITPDGNAPNAWPVAGATPGGRHP